MNRLDGKVAIVTGAASGLGLAAANTMAREGARVLYTDRDVEGATRAAAAAGASGAARGLDVTKEAEWKATVDFALAHFGRLDVLVNNAGVGVVKDIETTTL